MKSRQQVWDKISVLETQNQTLQNAVNTQQQQIAYQASILNALADSHGLLAWQLTTVDATVATTGEHTSLAFTPGGQAAISHYDSTNSDLKYAVFNGTNSGSIDGFTKVDPWANFSY